MQWQLRQRQRAELALNDQLEFMHSLLNGTPHPIYVRDRNGFLQSCNDSYLQTFNVKREEVIGKNVMPGSTSNAFEAREYQADYQRVMAEGTPRSEETTSELQSLMRISYALFCLKK